MTAAEKLSQFISHELLDESELIGSDENLLSDGMVDSLGMLRLVAYIEAEFGVKVPPEDFTVEHFRTIGLISEYLQSRADV